MGFGSFVGLRDLGVQVFRVSDFGVLGLRFWGFGENASAKMRVLDWGLSFRVSTLPGTATELPRHTARVYKDVHLLIQILGINGSFHTELDVGFCQRCLFIKHVFQPSPLTHTVK